MHTGRKEVGMNNGVWSAINNLFTVAIYLDIKD